MMAALLIIRDTQYVCFDLTNPPTLPYGPDQPPMCICSLTLGTEHMQTILLASVSTVKNMADVLGLNALYCFMAPSSACHRSDMSQRMFMEININIWRATQRFPSDI